VTAAGLSLRRLNRATLERQGLLERRTGAPAAAIAALAGLQAQHANQPYIALWSRLRDLTIAALQDALERKQVVRATVMRSTLHLVAAEDYAAYDSAVAAQRMANWAASMGRIGLDHHELHAALLAFCDEPRTVAEMEAHLDRLAPGKVIARNVPGGVRNAAFRLASAGGGLVHVPPSGFYREHGKPRYVAATTWLGPGGRPRDPADALDTVVRRYLGAYGPASFADVAKWLGQPRVAPLRASIERLGEGLKTVTTADGRELYDLVDGTVPREDRAAPPRFLSRWDSVLISYEDRDRILPAAHRAAVIKKNGDFLPTFLVDGVVAGLWSVTLAKGVATLRLEPFGRIGAEDRRALETEAEALVRFVEPDARDHALTWSAAG
jgi:hypothetical protein